MAHEARTIAIAFPIAEPQREIIRMMLRGAAPLPARYRDGRVMPCTECGMKLDVGPRVASSGARIFCPICGTSKLREEMRDQRSADFATILNLGNPDSKPE